MNSTTSEETFMDEVIEATPGGDSLRRCLQCGTCGGSCPSGPDMDHTPRALFQLIATGERETVLRSNAPWHCVACYYCMVRCPQEIHITDVMYTLKRMSVHAGLVDDTDAPDFSQTFIGFVDRYGRSFEFGLATRYHLSHKPLKKVGVGPLALKMLAKDRLQLRPKSIRGIKQLQAILGRAKELGGV